MKRLPLLIVALVLSACTTAPHPVHHKTASQWIKENRISYDATGYVVTPEWVRVYHDAWQAYAKKLPIREQVPDPDVGIILRPDGNYHVTFSANRRFDHLNEIDQNSP